MGTPENINHHHYYYYSVVVIVVNAERDNKRVQSHLLPTSECSLIETMA